MSGRTHVYPNLFPREPFVVETTLDDLRLERHRQPPNERMTGHCISVAFNILVNRGPTVDVAGDICGSSFRRPFTPSCYLFKPPDSPGWLTWGDRYLAFTRIRIEREIFDEVGYVRIGDDIRLNVDDQLVARLADALLEAGDDPALRRDRLYVESLVLALAARLSRRSEETIGETGRLHAATLQRVKKFIDANLEAALTITDLAEVARCSPYHFTRLFRATMGTTPHAFVMQRRLAVAEGLLRDTLLPISDIAYRLGFSSHSHFTSVFRTHFGFAPNAFRRRSMDSTRSA